MRLGRTVLGPSDPLVKETPPALTLDRHGVAARGWDDTATGAQGGQRALEKAMSQDNIQFKSKGGPGGIIISKGK
jgi:hypothetical protein